MTNDDSASSEKIKFLRDGVYIKYGGERRWVADPITVTAFATNNEDPKRDQAFVEIRFKNRSGEWRKAIISSSVLTGNNRDFVAHLAGLGYMWPSDRMVWSKIIAALSVAKPSRHIHLVDVPGWHGPEYVLPGESYRPQGPDRRRFQINPNPTVKLGAFRRAGSIEQWQKIAKFCCHSSRARCLMAASFAAPNLRLLKIPSFGLNLSGDTTTGKTSLITFACSVPGLNANEGPETWDGSTVAYEQRALGHRDSVIPFDDLSHVEGDPAAAAKLLTFRLSSNRPKAKAGQYLLANNVVDRDFRGIAISTSEHPIWQHLDHQRGHGRRVRGEQVRMINLRASASELGDVFDGPNANRRVGETTEERARKIEKYAGMALEYQGEAYRAYLTKLTADTKAEHALRNYMADYFLAATIPEQYRWLRRIARYFAAIYASAAVAIDYDILPWNKDTTLADIRKCMQDATEQLISTFESGSKIDATADQDDQAALKHFGELIDRAKFVPVNRRARTRKGFSGRLKKADGIIRPGKSGTARKLLFSETMNRWYPDASKRKKLTKLLRAHRIFRTGRRADTSTCEIFVSELGGKVPCYALSRKRLRRRRQEIKRGYAALR